MIATHTFLIDDINSAGLARLHQQMLAAADCVRKQKRSARPLIRISGVELGLIEWRESIANRFSSRSHGGSAIREVELNNGIAKVHGVVVIRSSGVECSVSSGSKNAAVGMARRVGHIGREPCTRAPYTAVKSVRSGTPSSG